MDTETIALLEEIDEIRRLAGMPKLDEVSRRDVLKGIGAGAAAAAVPGTATAHSEYSQEQQLIASMEDDAVELMNAFHDLDSIFEVLDRDQPRLSLELRRLFGNPNEFYHTAANLRGKIQELWEINRK